MKIYLHRRFYKNYAKLSPKLQQKFKERRNLFLLDEFNVVLNNHVLTGRWSGYRSINITGDIRAIFKRDAESALFVAIDSHSNLYS